jgi:hypothetical protein
MLTGAVRQIHQNQPADDGVEIAIETVEEPHVALNEPTLDIPARSTHGRQRRHSGRVALDAHHLAVGSNQPCRRHRDVARARAKLKYSHTAPSPAARDALSQPVEELCCRASRRCSSWRSVNT